jgi:pyruvate ferredoxin oxidoreductase gamma subunit
MSRLLLTGNGAAAWGARLAGVVAGADKHTILLINSHTDIHEWQDRLNYPGPIIILPAPAEVLDRAEMPFIGAICAGAAAALCHVISRDSLQQAIGQELGRLGSEIVEKNLHQALTTFELMHGVGVAVEQGGGQMPRPGTRPSGLNCPSTMRAPQPRSFTPPTTPVQ